MVKITLRNIGPFETKIIELKERHVNVIAMPNASGKSTILKSIILALSYPYISRLARETASRLGLWTEEPPQPMLRIGSQKGQVILEIKGQRNICEITREDIIRREGNGDERAIFTCLASMESELMRKIARGDPDLSWTVSALSQIDYYKKMRIIVEEILSDIKSIQEKTEKNIERRKDLLIKKENTEKTFFID